MAEQDILLKDLFSPIGRMSRSNYRFLSLLLAGFAACTIFLPGLIVALWRALTRRGSQYDLTPNVVIQEIAPFVYLIGFSLLAIVYIFISIQRMRDAGRPFWILLIPIWNLKMLYFENSKSW